MSVTEVSICNTALINIGCERIISLNDQIKRAILCKEQYPKIRDLVNCAHKWNFSTVRAELAQLTATPAWGYAYQYQLPSDCLRVLDTSERFEYKIEGGKLLTDQGTVFILYTAQITDTTIFPVNYADAVSFRLGAELAYPLVQSRELVNDMVAKYTKILAEARSIDAQEGTPDELHVDEFLNSRF